jgi:hypothetical protein
MHYTTPMTHEHITTTNAEMDSMSQVDGMFEAVGTKQHRAVITFALHTPLISGQILLTQVDCCLLFWTFAMRFIWWYFLPQKGDVYDSYLS